MHSLKKVFVTLCALMVPVLASAADPFPEKQVRLLVAYVPGGATDLIARFLANELSNKWGQQVIVENKPGAGGMIGAETIARSTPDGYSLLVAYTPEASINKLVYKQMRYDPEVDLAPIALVATAPLILVSGPKLKQSSFAALLKDKNGGVPISYGSAGTGGQQHLGGELLKILTGLDLIHVPYRGTGAAITDLLGGQIDVAFASSPPVLAHIRAGKLKPLFVTGKERQTLLPDVPTAVEVGLGDFDIPTWFGILGPKGMDPAVVARIVRDVAAILADKSATKPLVDQGLTISFLPPPKFKEFIAAEMAKYGNIVSKAGVAMQ